MAYDDWIKFRKRLETDGRVRKISKTLRKDLDSVLGKLARYWFLADDHADENGVLVGWEKIDVDDHLRCEGFCDSLPPEWLEVTAEGFIKYPDYLKHNGSTSKARAVDLKRKKPSKNVPSSFRDDSEKIRTREEKRESKIVLPSLVFPSELDTDECRAAWDRWLAYKRKKGQAYKSPDTQRQALLSAAPHGAEAFVKSLETAIRNNWAGFFPEKFTRAGNLDFQERKAARQADVVERAQALRDAQERLISARPKLEAK